MEKGKNMLIILIVLILVAAVLAFKLSELFSRFKKATRRIKREMHRTNNDKEYNYWLCQLRCQYLCLIPFVTKGNVMRLYTRIYYKPKHIRKEMRKNSVFHLLAPSVLGICICAICLCGVSWAWFTVVINSSTAAIQSATFEIENVQITAGSETTITLSPNENGKYTSVQLVAGEYTLSFKKSAGSTSSKGYFCISVIKAGESAGTSYYTSDDIGNETYMVIIHSAESITVTIEPIWGDSSQRISGGTTIGNNGEITVGDVSALNALAPKNSPAEPQNTMPTGPSAPSESPEPTESNTPAQEPTEPIASEPTETEPQTEQTENPDNEPEPTPPSENNGNE